MLLLSPTPNQHFTEGLHTPVPFILYMMSGFQQKKLQGILQDKKYSLKRQSKHQN